MYVNCADSQQQHFLLQLILYNLSHPWQKKVVSRERQLEKIGSREVVTESCPENNFMVTTCNELDCH